MPSPRLLLTFLLVLCFTLAVRLQLWYQNWAGNRASSASILNVIIGDSRRMFANHFFTKADAYFHSGFYPTIFDQAGAPKKLHMTETSGEPDEDEHDHAPAADKSGKKPVFTDLPGFMGAPSDWIEKFGRNFLPSEHVHLESGGGQREILPWLRISADLDPQRVETYTVAAYWLRTQMGKVDEAEQFLREGLRANPQSYEILFELGRVWEENRHETARAINLYELALKQWKNSQSGKKEPDDFLLAQITGHLATLEEQGGHLAKAIEYLELLKTVSPTPAAIQEQIVELRAKMK